VTTRRAPPPSSIYSAWYTSPTAYMVLSGTSMASPCVAGVYALYLQPRPAHIPSYPSVSCSVLSSSSLGWLTRTPGFMRHRGICVFPVSSFPY